MDMDIKNVLDFLLTAARSVGAELTSPWFYLQLGLMLAAAGIAFAVARSVRARIETSSLASNWPVPLRLFMRTLVGSAAAAAFALLMIASRSIMLTLTWPSRSYLLSVAAKLAIAWLVIRVITSGIRNTFIVRVVSIGALLVAALSIVGKLNDVIAALDSVSITLAGLKLTPLVAINFGVILIFALWLANIVSNFTESRITQSSDLTPSIQVLLVKIIRLGLIVFAVVIAMGAVGINLSALAIFSGAAGVGIGFGLQKIVANFISGIILLVDKSVKPGDLVTIGDSSGRISAMNTRYISVAAGDGREFLIPNEDLVTQKVTNWTYTDKNTLVKITFATSYEADPHVVCKLAIDTAALSSRALKSKPPNCLLTEFTDAGMRFSLTCWIADPGDMDPTRSEVMLALWDAFRREGIHVPYPVREIRIRGRGLPVETIAETSN